MPVFKIHRLRESQFHHFRWAPHTTGATPVKPRDYEPGGEVEAPSAYAAWAQLKDSGQPLRIGDLLGYEDGSLRICKYVGFEEAHWAIPEIKPSPESAPPPADQAPPGTEENPAKP